MGWCQDQNHHLCQCTESAQCTADSCLLLVCSKLVAVRDGLLPVADVTCLARLLCNTLQAILHLAALPIDWHQGHFQANALTLASTQKAHATHPYIGPACAHTGSADEKPSAASKKAYCSQQCMLASGERLYLTKLLAICMRTNLIGQTFNVLMQPLSQLLRQCHDTAAVIAKATTIVY